MCVPKPVHNQPRQIIIVIVVRIGIAGTEIINRAVIAAGRRRRRPPAAAAAAAASGTRGGCGCVCPSVSVGSVGSRGSGRSEAWTDVSRALSHPREGLEHIVSGHLRQHHSQRVGERGKFFEEIPPRVFGGERETGSEGGVERGVERGH